MQIKRQMFSIINRKCYLCIENRKGCQNSILITKSNNQLAQCNFSDYCHKYKAGTNYIDGSVKPVQEGLNIIDECSIAAVLYEAKDAAGKDVTLTGVDINTSEYRVAEARLKDGTDKDEWTTFELAFEYLPEKSYDSTKEYKLAIICSSSKEGDKFKGAANSTLIVDELEVIGE